MPTSQIAAQLYTLREFTKTPADIAKTLKRVKQIGYDAVQLSALGTIDPKELANILKGEGLTCAATHTHPDRLKNETQAVIDEHHLWACKYTAIGGFFPTDPKVEDWHNFTTDYAAVARKFAGSGMTIGYHNHSHEMAHYGRTTALQLLVDELPKDVWFEIDTYWITHGGGDPVQWFGKLAGRLPCVHLKDMVVNPKREQFMAEVGEGNLNWPGILAAGKAASVEWYIVEQDETYGKDPFDCLATSLKNLRALGLN
jgi:sugar phosphate isomerase/epimerase